MPAVEAFLRQSDAVIGHDASAQLGRIVAPTQVTIGRHDLVCSTGFADALTEGIAGAELVVFEDCAHAPIYENVKDFNDRTAGVPAAALGVERAGAALRCRCCPDPGNTQVLGVKHCGRTGPAAS